MVFHTIMTTCKVSRATTSLVSSMQPRLLLHFIGAIFWDVATTVVYWLWPEISWSHLVLLFFKRFAFHQDGKVRSCYLKRFVAISCCSVALCSPCSLWPTSCISCRATRTRIEEEKGDKIKSQAREIKRQICFQRKSSEGRRTDGWRANRVRASLLLCVCVWDPADSGSLLSAACKTLMNNRGIYQLIVCSSPPHSSHSLCLYSIFISPGFNEKHLLERLVRHPSFRPH